MRSRSTVVALGVIFGLVAVVTAVGVEPGRVLGASTANVTVDAGSAGGSMQTQLSTQLVWPGTLESLPSGQTRLNALLAPLIRIHAGTDGGYDAVALPMNVAWTIEGRTKPA